MKILFIGLLCWVMVGCAVVPRPRLHGRHNEDAGVAVGEATVAAAAETTENPAQPVAEASASFSQTGVASWYGEDFHGKGTSSGEVYDMFKLTAAHPTLPFHTLVEVTNLENSRTVIVRINDRGPFVKGRIIDLSYRAAQVLGFDEIGTANVALRIVKFFPGPMGAVDPVRVSYFLQVGAFQQYENAFEQARKVRFLCPDLHFSIWKEEEVYKIFSEKIADRSKLEKIRDILLRSGISSFIREIH